MSNAHQSAAAYGATSVAPAVGFTTGAPSFAPVSAFPSAVGSRESFDSEVFGNRSGRLRRHVQNTLLWSALLAGTVITLYRTDALFNGARALQMESAFLQLEQSWFGGPPAGTPRQVKAMLSPEAPVGEGAGPTSAADSPIPGLSAAALANGLTIANSNATASAEVPEADEPETSESAAESAPADPPKAEPSEADAKPTTRTADATPKRGTTPKRKTRPASAARSASAKAVSAKASPKSEPAAAAKPTPEPGSDAFLRMSIENAVKSDSKKASSGSKKAGSGSYDPLNGEL